MPEYILPETISNSNKRVCAVIVAYYPDSNFESLLEIILPQVDTLIVVDNTPDGSRQLTGLITNTKPLHLIENKNNLGVATALNQGLAYACANNFDWMLSLDQDTKCYPDLVKTLLQVYDSCNLNPAVIGSNYLDIRNNHYEAPLGKDYDYLERKTVITSGSLVDVAVASVVGGFRDDYFIDQVDHEFCLRIRAHKHRVVISRKPVMAHSVGNIGGAKLPFLGVLPNHSPLRKYYIARNTLVTVANYWKKEPVWCLRRFTRLMLGFLSIAIFEEQRIPKLRAFAAGVIDAASRRMGPCLRAWLFRA